MHSSITTSGAIFVGLDPSKNYWSTGAIQLPEINLKESLKPFSSKQILDCLDRSTILNYLLDK